MRRAVSRGHSNSAAKPATRRCWPCPCAVWGKSSEIWGICRLRWGTIARPLDYAVQVEIRQRWRIRSGTLRTFFESRGARPRPRPTTRKRSKSIAATPRQRLSIWPTPFAGMRCSKSNQAALNRHCFYGKRLRHFTSKPAQKPECQRARRTSPSYWDSSRAGRQVSLFPDPRSLFPDPSSLTPDTCCSVTMKSI